jgi:hypothetical protein
MRAVYSVGSVVQAIGMAPGLQDLLSAQLTSELAHARCSR